MILIGIVGTGGFAREIAPIAKKMMLDRNDSENFKIVFVSNSSEKESEFINGFDVISEDIFLKQEESIKKYFNIAIADSKLREKIANKFTSLNVEPFKIVCKTATFLDDCVIAEGAIICTQSIMTSNIKIGKYFHSNLNSYVAHDCVIGDFVTFAPSVQCNGNIIIHDYAYIGAGAILKQGTDEKPLIIGEGAVIGMGAVVTKDVAPYTVVVGNPAKVLQKK